MSELAERADLALQLDIPPPGSLTYSDSKTYTVAEAIDLVNGILLTKGYTLIRRGRLLTVLNLEDESPIPDVLVEFVPMTELDDRGEFELIKTLFPLVKMDPADAEAEIQPMIGPGRSLVVLGQSRQLLVTETAGKLRTIRQIIEAVENPRAGSDPVEVITLKYAPAEEIVAVARPLLGLEEEATTGDDISISIGPLGARLFVTGSEENLEILKALVTQLDAEPDAATEGAIVFEQLELRSHRISAADAQSVLSVMQTLMAGLPDVRLSIDPKTGKMIAFARPSEHEMIESTIREIEGESLQFEVIPLNRLDPEIAVLMVNQMFSTSVGEGEEAVVSGPRVDADPITGRMFVRGTNTEINQIRDVIDKLRETDTVGRANLRLIPLSGPEAMNAVERAKRFWAGENKIQMIAPGEYDGNRVRERNVHPPEPLRQLIPEGLLDQLKQGGTPEESDAADTETEEPVEASSDSPVTSTRQQLSKNPVFFVSQQADSGEGQASETATAALAGNRDQDIYVEATANGILIHSKDTAALDEFEELLRTLAGPQALQDSEIAFFYLKFAKAEPTAALIKEILGGSSSGGGSLIGDMASNLLGGGGGILGALLGGGGVGGGGEGSVVTVGASSIVADARLNRLIVQGPATELEQIDELLQAIDKENSITDVQTAGRARLIPLTFAAAEDVVAVLKDAYAGRIGGGSGGQQQRQPSPEDFIKAIRGGGRGGGGGGEAKSEEPKMTLAVESRSNSIIVTATEQQFEEVKMLVEAIDELSAQPNELVEVQSVRSANPAAVQQALVSLFGESVTSTSSSRSQSSSSRSDSSRRSSESASRQAEFFRRVQEGLSRSRSGDSGSSRSRSGSSGSSRSRSGDSGSSRSRSGGSRSSGSSRGR